MAYDGFFVRDALGQTPTDPPTGSSISPDIIPLGLQPSMDPQAFATPEGYATDSGGTLYPESPNYVYLRALNTAESSTGSYAGQAWLYYTMNDLLLWPAIWKSDGISVLGEDTNAQPIVATNAGQVCVTSPFIWTPPSLAAGADHHCLISYIADPPLQPPPWSPTSGLPNLASLEDLAQFLWAHPNIGLRNVVDVVGIGPTWSHTVWVSGPSEWSNFQIGLQCTGMPNAGDDPSCRTTVSFTVAAGPNGDDPPPVCLKPTVPFSPDAVFLATVTWPPNCRAAMTIGYASNGDAPPPAGAGISAFVTLSASSPLHATALAHAQRRPGGARRAHIIDAAGAKTGEAPSTIPIGARHYRF